MNTNDTNTIVMVEDEARVRFLVARALTSAGYRVLAAPDAPMGLRLLEAHALKVRLLVTDVVMPGTGGLQLCEQARRIRPDLPVLFMSGYPDARLALAEQEARTALLRKPFSPKQLCEKVRAMLDSATLDRPQVVAA